MLTIIKDVNLEEHLGEYDLILVGTNEYCTMAQGFQRHVMVYYPYAMEANMKTKYGDPAKLGEILECPSDREGEPTFVLLFICHGFNFRPHVIKD